jgi:hypothetical protein
MTIQTAIRRFGPPPGAAGIEVVERPGGYAIAGSRKGTSAIYGVLRRGPQGVAIPINGFKQYLEIFGDPASETWHLFTDSAFLTPDVINAYFRVGGGAGQLWVTRIEGDGKSRPSELIAKNKLGANALRIRAANGGRWGGKASKIAVTPVIAATARTFTLVAPGVLANEFVGADAEFTSATGKKYRIVANTAALETGETIFTVAAQYNLVGDGVAGPVALAGTATYTRYKSLAGTISYDLTQPLTGTVNLTGTVATGTGTDFMTELAVGRNIYYNNEARVVTSITSDTTLTIDAPFTAEGTGLTVDCDNLEVVGTTTAFTTETAVGDTLYQIINGVRVGRKIAAIASATSLTLASGFPIALTGVTGQVDSYTVTGTGTAFNTEVQAGQYIVDPNRAGRSIKVASVTSATSLKVAQQFSGDFTAAQLTKQNQLAEVTLVNAPGEGLAVEFGQGTRFPATHFSMKVYFNSSLVLNITDASLDATDPLFVEDVVNNDPANLAYRTGNANHQKSIVVESLWTSAYTTGMSDDVRPCNGSGKILLVEGSTAYVSGDYDLTASIGQLFYPNPYALPRSYYRVQAASSPVALQGTISSSGGLVTGTSTNFLTAIAPGDAIYIPATGQARKVRSILSDTSLMLESAFLSNLSALTKASKAGTIQVERGYDLTTACVPGDRYLVSFLEQLKGGYDGDLGALIPYHFVRYADIDRNHLEAATFGKNLGLIRIACPDGGLAADKAWAAYATAKAFEYRFAIPMSFGTASSAEAYVNQVLGRGDFISGSFPSYGYIANPFGPGDRLVPLTGHIMGGQSRQAEAVDGWFSPFAGVNAILTGVTKLPVDLLPNEEALLNLAGIQPIKYVNGNPVVFGARIPAISSTYDFLHIRQMISDYIRIFLEARPLLEILFLPNQPNVAERALLAVENFFRREYLKGALNQNLSFNEAVEIKIDRGDNGNAKALQDRIVAGINGELDTYISVVPAGVVEKFRVNLSASILVTSYGSVLTNSNI